MRWHNSNLDCYQVELAANSEPELLSQLGGFWGLFICDVLSANLGKPWDYLLISMRGLDGRAGIYQQMLIGESPIVAWCSVEIPMWEKIIYELPTPDDPTDLSFDIASEKQDERFARLIIEAAKRVDLACLVGRAELSIRLRFQRYDDQVPFWDVTLDADNNEIHNELMVD